MPHVPKPALAAVLVLAAGCGGGGDRDPDAPPNAPDAAVDAAPIGSVRVTTYTRCCSAPTGTPAAAVAIYLLRPDHTLATVTETGADGTVTLGGVERGSAVMAVYPEGPTNVQSATTVLGVEPGDALVFGEDYVPQDITNDTGIFTVTYPSINAFVLYAMLPCSTGSGLGPSPATVTLDADCQVTGTVMPFLAFDEQNNMIASATLRDIDLAIGASFTIDAWSLTQPVEVRAPVGPEVFGGEVGMVWRYGPSAPGDFRNATVADGALRGTVVGPTDADDLVASAITLREEFGDHAYAQRFPAGTSVAAIDARPLPWMGTALVSASDQEAQWTQDGDGGDAIVVEVETRHVDGAGTHTQRWNVIAPVGGNHLSWSDFPADVPAPRGDDEIAYGDVTIVDLGAASYAALRAAPEWEIRCPTCAVEEGARSSGARALSGGVH